MSLDGSKIIRLKTKPNDKIIAESKFKALADASFSVAQMMGIENSEKRGKKIAPSLSPFPSLFLKAILYTDIKGRDFVLI